MNSAAYWAERTRRREEEAYLRGGELSARLFEEYQRSARETRRQINDFYVRYARENGLTLSEAMRRMNRREAQEWKAAIGEYVERIAREADPSVRQRLKAELDALSYNSSITRLDALLGQIQAEMDSLYARGTAQLKEAFGEGFRESYYRAHFDIQQRAGFYREIAGLTPQMVEDVVSYPWSGADFSERLWQNNRALVFHSREILTQGLIQGKGIGPMSKELADQMGNSFKAAERLIRTESSHFHNEADIAAYQAAHIEEYEFMAALQERTCAACGALDGKHFRLDERKPGVNFPPLHPNCRCTTVQYDPEEALDWLNSGEPMPENMTYAEWKEKQEAEHGKGYVESERKREYNSFKDREQFEQYRKRLGRDAPARFDDFTEIKYHQPERWDVLKRTYSEQPIRSQIRSDSFNKTINHEKQARHMKGVGYIEGRSYLTVSEEEAQALVNRYAGTGILQRDRKGKWKNTELIIADKEVGNNVNPKTGEEIRTCRFYIHYSKTGVHIVPTAKGENGE